ncbi:hypothetical protein CRV01_11980 [Arcobacter sp. CECT 8983]|uniref:hypothetical protein n=1 Tax=Arcobacter sp. CECT 8983 TaxID=2044508 RepID=UPI00100A3319|nr:hypothetical protein [Arcobacter sp. CECT 8983]RXJ88461.1 hypothetical protein CRV01_11980 [Arcobacter sp. CECT 8983]
MQSLKLTLDKAYYYKLFMLVAFFLFASVMYQGHIQQGGIYSILFFVALALCAFQVATTIYVTFVKRVIQINISNNEISWNFSDNDKNYKNNKIDLEDIKDIKTEINYLIGNFYSSFQVTFLLKDDSEVVLTDGIIYDFGLKKAEEVCRFLLDNNLGEEQDIKFANLIKELNIDTDKTNQKFTKKQGDSYYVGILSDNKKEFLSLRIQIETLYDDYKKVEKNANNEYLVSSDTIKNSHIHLKSNAIGLFVEFKNVKRKEELKTLKEMGKRKKIGF